MKLVDYAPSASPSLEQQRDALQKGRGRQAGNLHEPAAGKGSDKRPAKFSAKPAVGSGSIMYMLEKVKE